MASEYVLRVFGKAMINLASCKVVEDQRFPWLVSIGYDEPYAGIGHISKEGL